jgi:hypothetical protein
MDCIHLAQDRGQWRALVSMVMNFGFRKMLGNSREADRPAASQEGMSFMELVCYLLSRLRDHT